MKLDEIKKLLNAAIDTADSMGVKITAVFLDSGGHMRALLRMDGACFGDIDIAINKAYTAAAWQIDSGDLYEDALPSGDFFGMHFSNHQKVATFIGGMPVYQNGVFVGSIGVSGGTKEQDQMCLNKIKELLMRRKENNDSGVC